MPRNIPGLTPDEADAYRDALKDPGARTFRRATVMDLDHKPLRRLTEETRGGMIGGQVRWNTKADVHTDATIIFSDFDDDIDLDLRHLVRAEMGVQTSVYGRLWCPVITGWVQACNDVGHETELLLHDKMAFGLHESERGHGKRGEYVAAVIVRMWRQAGERHFNVPDRLLESGPKLADEVHWGGGNPAKSITRMSRKLAKRANLQVFPDQLGRITIRRVPGEPAASWVEPSRDDVRDDVDLRLLEPITWARDYQGIRNRVIGGGKRNLRSVAVTRDGYRFSPAKMTRGGEPVRLTHRFEDDTFDTRAELNEATEAMVARMSAEKAGIQITSSPGPWVVPLDRFHAAKRNGRATDFWLNEGSLELDGSGMAIGYQQRLRRRANTKVTRSTGSGRPRRGERRGEGRGRD